MTQKPSWMVVLDEVGAVMSSLDVEAASQLIDAIVDSPNVFVSGEGRSGLVARSFAMRLMHMGVAAYVMGETICPSISDGDLLAACSGSGTTPITCLRAEQAKSKRAVTVCAVTGRPESRLARGADIVVTLPGTGKTADGVSERSVQLSGSLFEQCLLILFDGLVLDLMRKLGKTRQDMTKRHANVE